MIVWSGTFSTVLPDFEYSWHFSANVKSGRLLRKQGSGSFEQDIPNGLERSGDPVLTKTLRHGYRREKIRDYLAEWGFMSHGRAMIGVAMNGRVEER